MLMYFAEGGFNPLHVEPGFLFWSTVTFVALLVILTKVAWKPLMQSIEEREGKISGDIDAAEKARVGAEETLQEYTLKLEQAAQEARQVVEEARATAEKAREGILEEAREASDALKEQARRDIEAARVRALSDIKGYMVDVAMAVSSRVVSNAVDQGEHQRLVDEMVTKAGDSV